MINTAYRITATIHRDGQALSGDTAEVLGHSYGQLYTSKEDACSDAEDMQDEAPELGLDGVTYDVEEVTIEVGAVEDETLPMDDDGEEYTPEFEAWVELTVRVDGEAYPIGCSVGVPPSMVGTARAAGAGTGPYVGSDGDLDAVPFGRRDAVRAALERECSRLWAEVEARRGGSRPLAFVVLDDDPATIGPEATREDLETFAERMVADLSERFGADVRYRWHRGAVTHCEDHDEIDEFVRDAAQGDGWIQWLA